jgi:hypothetical protein
MRWAVRCGVDSALCGMQRYERKRKKVGGALAGPQVARLALEVQHDDPRIYQQQHVVLRVVLEWRAGDERARGDGAAEPVRTRHDNPSAGYFRAMVRVKNVGGGTPESRRRDELEDDVVGGRKSGGQATTADR